ncbi:hypothetical protein RFI_12229, partial [Reticulomyxa filosa]
MQAEKPQEQAKEPKKSKKRLVNEEPKEGSDLPENENIQIKQDVHRNISKQKIKKTKTITKIKGQSKKEKKEKENEIKKLQEQLSSEKTAHYNEVVELQKKVERMSEEKSEQEAKQQDVTREMQQLKKKLSSSPDNSATL